MLLGACLVLLASPTLAQDRPQRRDNERRGHADPSAVIAAELAFARLARDKGQWTAFRETLAKDAVMFVPQRVKAAEWLKGRADPPLAVSWQPHRVWSSCDGSYAVTQGSWQLRSASGTFTTIWQRQKKRGAWKWVLDHADALPAPLAVPEMIASRTADCSKVTESAVPGVMDRDGALLDDAVGTSRDGSLVWNSSVRPDGAREITVWLWHDGKLEEVLKDRVAAPPPASSPGG